MARRDKDREPIFAAGGIVVRAGEPLIAIVQLAKDNEWVLPKGKLNKKETAVAAARREVVEETGHEVRVDQFLGTMFYMTRGTPKIVQYWRMEAQPQPSRKLMTDVKAVRWLPLDEAIRKLSLPRERKFLGGVGPVALGIASTARPTIRQRVLLWFGRKFAKQR